MQRNLKARKAITKAVSAKGKKDYHKKGCFAADFIEADKRGELIIPKKGENTLQAVKRYMAEKKEREKKMIAQIISLRLPAYALSAAKAQAKQAGIPYTSYLASIIERAVVA